MYSEQCKSCIVDGCVEWCKIRQKYMLKLRLEAQPVNYRSTKSDRSSQLKLNNDLISRKQVLNASHFVACWDGVEHFSLEVVDADFIQKLPSVQPERKKGKWITVPGRLGNEVECNQCHSVFWYWMGNYRFCPSCGARMDGESNG